MAGVLDCLVALAQVASDDERLREALEWIDDADELYRSEQFDNPIRLVQLLRLLGSILQWRGETAGAFIAWVEAVAVSEHLTPAGLGVSRQLDFFEPRSSGAPKMP
jgi:hypothetical protein